SGESRRAGERPASPPVCVPPAGFEPATPALGARCSIPCATRDCGPILAVTGRAARAGRRRRTSVRIGESEGGHVDVESLAEVAPRERFTRICALTGAGISVAAGLGTFRGPDGRWTLAPEVERAMHAHLLPGNVDALWEVWGGMWKTAAAAGPTPAHRALATVGASVITQNVDGLHQAAGSVDVVELHGSAGLARCLDDAFCGWIGPADEARAGDPPGCAQCTEPARP